MVNQWRPRVGATSKVWWQVRWPDPMWADDTVVSHPGYLISQVGKGRRLEQLEQGVGRLQQHVWRAHARQSVCKCSLSVSLLSLGVLLDML